MITENRFHIMLIALDTVDSHVHKWGRYGLPLSDPFSENI